MTSERRFEQELPALLDDLYMGPMPTYRDRLLRQTARTRQRPAWSFLERWLPMVDVARQPVLVPRLPWRQLGILAILALLIATAAVAFVGSQPRLPAPFGVARNGLIAYEADGDIYTADPVTGVATAIVAGPETDLGPRFSRDGTRIAFMRQVQGVGGTLYVGRADGQELIALTPEPRPDLGEYSFSPDGRDIMFTQGPPQQRELWIVKNDGSGLHHLDVGMSVFEPSFRPPTGAEIVFGGGQQLPFEGVPGVYRVDIATAVVHTIVAPVSGVGRGLVRVSPDGSRIAYSSTTEASDRNTYRIHVAAADGSGDITLRMPNGAIFEDAPVWSNDGERLAVARGYALRNQDMALAVVPADGSGFGVETGHGLTGCCGTVYEWAPDDTTIVVMPIDRSGQPVPPLLWDPLTGATTPAPWSAISDPAWQRLAP
jgi:Tol biopolymer transport system component